MRKKVKRVVASTMAALMMLSLAPVSAFNGTLVNNVIAADLTYEGLNLSGGVKAGTSYFNSLGLQPLSDVNYSEKSYTIEGVSYPGYLDIGGTDADGVKKKIPTKNAYKLTPTKTGDMSIAFKLNSKRTFYLVKEDGTEVASVANATSASAYYYKTFSLTAGETYYMYAGGNKLFLYGVEWDCKAEKATAITMKAKSVGEVEETSNGKITWLSNFDVNSDNNSNFTDKFDGTNNSLKIEKNNQLSTKDLFTDSLSGQFKSDVNIIKGAVKYEPSENGSLSLDIKINKSSSKDDKPFFIISEAPDGTKTLMYSEKATTSTSTYKNYECDVKAGYTYYIGQAGSQFVLFGIRTTLGTIYDITPWEEVAVPKISEVTATSEGFQVTVEGKINKYTAAQNIVVTMLHNGGQVAETNITNMKDSTTVDFTAYDNGDYTFIATAQRLGSPDKVSEAKEVKNYVLGVKLPKITWAENKGNGKVYLDWVNISDAKDYTLTYNEKGADDSSAKKIENITSGDYTVEGLTVDKTYTFSVVANREDGQKSASAAYDLKVTAAAEQSWYVSTIGSAQATEAVITKEDGTTSTIKLESGDSAKEKKQTVEADNIANTSGNIKIKGQATGKISDDEDGFSYYYTKVDPEAENFEMSATFKITDNSLTPDNQTGFGVVAADTLGVNNWGNADYTHKYFNYFSSMMYSSKQNAPSMRYITGYTSSDTSNKDGVDRVNNNVKFNDLVNKDTFLYQKDPKDEKKDVYLTSLFAKDAEYTFTVRKTDDGYEAVATTDKGTQTQTLSVNDFTSVQEDGTVCVGVMVSRKISVEISDIKFTKSASKGLKSEEAVEDKITPSLRVYSSNTCGADEYEYTVVPNCAGTLSVVSSADGKAVTKSVSANEVVRISLPVEVGNNTIKTEFKPKASDNITSDKTVTSETTVTRKTYGITGQTIIVSADGKSTGDGTEESPLDINTAVSYAQPGQTILMKNGVYDKSVTINRSVSGTADKPINLIAESVSKDGTDGVVLSGVGLTVIGSYWHVYGLYVKDSSGVGIQVSGNYNTIDMCTVNHAANSGVQISRNGGADNSAGIQGKLWPTGNLIKNCESFDNCDAGRNDADGFAAKLTCGNDNKFYGCISHNNIDDGWDLYAKSVTGMIGSVTIENCVAYNNGWLTTDKTTEKDYNYGEGNGFKLGGGYLKGGHKLINCVSFGNHAKGITSNSCPDISITRCTAYGNGNSSSYSVGLNTMNSMLKEWKVNGLISMSNSKLTGNADLIPFSQHGNDNYIYNGSASYNNLGQKATDDWFESVDMTKLPTRNENGTINMNGLLVIKSNALSDNVGAKLDTTSENAISVKPELGKTVEHKYGEWTATKEATCTENGQEHRVCASCGLEETREIKALGHKYATEWTTDKEATTLEEGSKSHHCLREGCTSVTDVTVIPKVEAPKKTDVKTEPTGDMKDSVKVDGIKNTDEILEFTESEVEAIKNGDSVSIKVNVEDATKTVTNEDVEKIAATLKKDDKVKDYTVASYINIDVIKKVGDKESKLTTTTKELQFEITLTGNLINKDSSKERTYKILRIHDGNVDILDAAFDKDANKLTFKTDKFSTYAIIYNDKAIEVKPDDKPVVVEPTQPATKDETPATEPVKTEDPAAQTGDSMHAAPYALAMIMSAGFAILAVSRKKKYVK